MPQKQKLFKIKDCKYFELGQDGFSCTYRINNMEVGQRNKPKLSIIIPMSEKKDSNLPSEDKQELVLRPLYSVRNLQKKLFKVSFQEDQFQGIQTDRRNRRLQRQKNMLLSSFDVLRVGAISAIAQKQEQIENLRSQMGQQEVQQLQSEIQQLLRERVELREDVRQLQEKLASERESFMRLLEEKDRVIEQLYVELGSTQIQIEKLQKFQEINEKKIKIIEEENDSLFHQLQQQKISHIIQSHSLQRKDIEDRYSIKNQQDNTEQFDVQEERKSQSRKSFIDLEAIQSKHKQELQEIVAFYQKRMSDMRDIYERQLQLWPSQKSRAESLNQQQVQQVPSLTSSPFQCVNRLSSQLNMKKLSDCYSMTKRDISRIDKESAYTIQNDPPNFALRFAKKNNVHTPASQTTTSKKYEGTARNPQPQIVETKDNFKETKKEPIKGTNLPVVPFMLGAVSGGIFTFLLGSLLNKG